MFPGLIVLALLMGSTALADAGPVTVDGARTYQLIEGFGANINHRSWNANELPPVLDALIDQAGMTLFRVIFDNNDWEATNDNSDPNLMNWTYYNQIYSSADFQKMWDLGAYLNQRGITDGLMFNFQGIGPDWLGGSDLTSGYESEWAEMVASLLVYARYTQHLKFTLVGPDNEQDYVGNQGVRMTVPQYTNALHILAELLDSKGLSDVRFVGPDLAGTSTDWLTAMMDDPVIMAKLAHFGLHSYYDQAGGSSGIYDFLQQSAYPDRTYWMTEFNVWCDDCNGIQGDGNSWDYASGAARYLLYHLAYGASAALVWDGYDGQYNYYDYPGGWSFWGLFAVDDTNAETRTYTPRKSFYTLAQISKFVQPGAQQIDVTPWPTSDPILAFYHPNSGQVTLTGINSSSGTFALSGILTHLPPVASFDLYYTDSTTNLCYSSTIPVTAGAFTATVPANCVFTLVGVDPAGSAISVLITNPPNGAHYNAPATIPIQATAATPTGSVSQVAFFCGTTNLGEALAPPYGIAWSNVQPGTYVLTARATNSVGNYGLSSSVHVTVVGSATQISITPSNAAVVPYGTLQFTAIAADALGTALHPQPAFSWSVSGGGTIDTNGLFAAGSSPGGPFTVTAVIAGITDTAGISIATNLNLAPAGVGHTWYGLTASTDDSPEASAPGVNDSDLDTDVPLLPGGSWDAVRAYEAAGVVWPTPQTINRVIYVNGSYTSTSDGVFTSGFGLQFSPDGVTWTNAGSAWVLSPAYTYNSPASANVSFTFAGGTATVRGVRCVGRVHPTDTGADSWVANATELQAFAAPAQPVGPHVTAPPTNQTVLVGSIASFTVAASGTPFLGYQWQFNGTNLAGATNEMHSLTNVQPPQAGSYRVVVTNAAGSATSAVATLTVLTNPLLLAARTISNGAFVFTLSGNAGYTYTVEMSTNLVQWVPYSTISNAAGQVDFTDPAASNSVTRFYRARLTY